MNHRIVRAALACAGLATVAAFGAGVALLGRFLVCEQMRLSPGLVVLMWAGEAVAGVWFLRFGWRYVVRDGLVRPTGEWPVTLWFGWLTLCLGWATDAAATAYAGWSEGVAYDRSVPAEGRVVASEGRPSAEGDWVNYSFRGEFTAADGRPWAVEYLEEGTALPAETAEALAAGRLPAPLPLRYDPLWPRRTWLPKQEPDWGDRVYVYTAVVLGGQAIALGLAAFVRLVLFSAGVRRVPPFEQAAPFAAAAVLFLLFGGGRWLSGL